MKLLKVGNTHAEAFEADIEEEDAEWALMVELGGITAEFIAESDILENADLVVCSLDRSLEEGALFNIPVNRVLKDHVIYGDALCLAMARTEMGYELRGLSNKEIKYICRAMDIKCKGKRKRGQYAKTQA